MGRSDGDMIMSLDIAHQTVDISLLSPPLLHGNTYVLANSLLTFVHKHYTSAVKRFELAYLLEIRHVTSWRGQVVSLYLTGGPYSQ